MVEQMLAWTAPAHGLTCTALRYFNAAGATERNGEDHDPETHLIPQVLLAAENGSPGSIFRTDHPTPDRTTVPDYIHGVELAHAHPPAPARDHPGLRNLNCAT